jgi:Flp pilus assembly protein TadG
MRVPTRLPASPVGPGGGRLRGDGGNAIVEFVFLGVLLLAPLMYFVLAVSAVQRNLYGVTQAAREAGRAYATGTAANAADRARYAARLALEDQGVSGADAVIRYGAAAAGCDSATTQPWPVAPGGEFAVCVSRPFTVPGVPGFLVGARSSVTGRYIVHLDEYRDYGGDPAGPPP